MPIDSIPCNFITASKCRFLSFLKSKNYYEKFSKSFEIIGIFSDFKFQKFVGRCKTFIKMNFAIPLPYKVIKYENDKNMKFWEFFEGKKCFVFIIFVTAVNLVVLDAFWINSRYLHQVRQLFATCFCIEPFLFSKKSTFF